MLHRERKLLDRPYSALSYAYFGGLATSDDLLTWQSPPGKASGYAGSHYDRSVHSCAE